MKVSYTWLNHHFRSHTEKHTGAPYLLPSPEKVAELLTFHAYEVESIEKVGDDHVLTVAVLPNRAHDSLSHKGVARELARLLGKEIYPEKFDDYEVRSDKEVFVDVKEPALAPRYMAVVIEGVTVGESPAWLKERLFAVGQRPINNIVDVTNFVMQETGQPLHAFDLDKLAKDEKGNPRIIVRKAGGGELTLLDNNKISLGQETLVIADQLQSIAIAGVKGGKSAEITNTTTNIVIESANFEGTQVRKVARALNLRTDSSMRFEQGISPELAEEGIRLAIDMILKLVGPETKVGTITDVYPRKRAEYVFGVSTTEVNKLLGTDLNESEVEKILKQLHFKHEKVDPLKRVLELAPKFANIPYKFGASISYDAPAAFDCSSFTASLFAQAGIGIPRMAVDQYAYVTPISESELVPGDLVFSNTGTGKIHYESVEFMPGKMQISEGIDHVGLCLSEGMVIHATRTAGKVVIESLKESAQFKNIVGYGRATTNNEKRFVVTAPKERLDLMAARGFLVSGIKEDLIEEIGRIYGYENIKSVPPGEPEEAPAANKEFYYTSKAREILRRSGFSEVMTYSFVSRGEVELKNPLADDKRYLRSSLHEGLSQSLELNSRNLPLLGLSEVRIFEIGKVFEGGKEYLSLGIGINSGAGKNETGALNDAKELLAAELGVSVDAAIMGTNVLLINFDELLSRLPAPSEDSASLVHIKGARYQPMSAYPFVLRDVAVFVPSAMEFTDVLKVIEKEAGSLLVQKRLFDVFKKGDKTSYAFNLVFQSREKTLSDEEVNKVMEKVTAALNAKEGWQVR